MFPLHGFTNYQDIQLGTRVLYIRPEHVTPLMWMKLLDDKKTIRVYVNSDGWKYDVIGEKIKYEYEQNITFKLNRNITHLYEKRVENVDITIDNKTVYYNEIIAYNRENYPIVIWYTELFIQNNTEAWNKLYNSTEKGQRF